jgi:hypothetical protein
MGTTPNMGIPYPESTDAVANGATAIESLATTVDSKTGLVFIQSQTITTSVPYLEMTSVFSSSFTNYRIVISNVQSTNNVALCFILGTNLTSGLYYGSIYYDQYTGGTVGTARRNGGNNGFLGLTDSAGANGGYSFDLNNPAASKEKTHHGTYDGRNFAGWQGGLIATTSVFSSIRFFNETGNLVQGSFSIYGYGK